MKRAGYLNGSIGRTRHLHPTEWFDWGLGPDADDPGEGIWMYHLRNGWKIELFRENMTEFLWFAKEKDVSQ